MITLNAPDSHCCVGFAGSEYAIHDGHVEVPDLAEAPLHAHGYRRPKPDDAMSAAPASRKRR